MKKYILLIISVIVMILSFLNSWFWDQLLDSLFIFALIPSLVLFVGWIICLVVSIIKLIKDRNIFNIISFIVIILTALLVLLFPFREAKARLELTLYEDERLEIIKMIEDNKLEVDDLGNVKLPNKYKKISTSGEVAVYQNNEDGKVVAFWVFRGMLSGSVQLIYSTGGEQLIRDNETGHPIVNVDKLKDNWYYVVTDY